MPILLGVAILLYGSLYTTGVFVAGLATGNIWAWRGALATAGVTYLCYFVQSLAPRSRVVIALLAASITLGAVAGLLLLTGA